MHKQVKKGIRYEETQQHRNEEKVGRGREKNPLEKIMNPVGKRYPRKSENRCDARRNDKDSLPGKT